MIKDLLYKLKSVMIGHAVGDALGVPVEFCEREELDADPVTDMRGFGTYPVPAGAWSDDTSMSLAALDALAKKDVGHHKTIDRFLGYSVIMDNFVKWLFKGKYTPSGKTFDVGNTCFKAISEYALSICRRKNGEDEICVGMDPALLYGLCDERSNGNGSLMRIHPFVLYAHAKGLGFDEWRWIVRDASMLTHAHERSIMGCLIYAIVLFHLLGEKPTKDLALHGLIRAKIAWASMQNSITISAFSKAISFRLAAMRSKARVTWSIRWRRRSGAF